VRDLFLGDAVGDFGAEAGGGRNDGYVGVGIEAVVDAAGGDLFLSIFWSMVTMVLLKETYLAAADDKHLLALDLPGNYEAAAALDLGKL